MTSDDDVKRIMDKNDDYTHELFESFNLLVDNINQIATQIAEMPDYSDVINESVEQMFENLPTQEAFERNLEDSAEVLFDNDWWPINSMRMDFYWQLLKQKDEVNKENLTDFIVKYYNEKNCMRLENIIKKWDLDEFKDNQEIIEDSLWAHKKSKFTLTVPALAIQVECIIRSYLDHKSECQFSKYRKELKNQYAGLIDKMDDRFEKFLAIQNLNFLDKCMENFTKSFSPSTPREFDDLYRNPLFHGQYKNYNSIEMSTKLFLFLDMLHHILSDLEEYNKENKKI